MEGDVLRAIEMASHEIYALFSPTPIEILPCIPDTSLLLKREDLSPIHSYKWRGAFFAMKSRCSEKRRFVTASAGNHAQGMAASARKLGTEVTIFMPRSTPKVKHLAVQAIGGKAVQIVMAGEEFSEAQERAQAFAEEECLPFVSPYDDLAVMGGQGTIAQEVITAVGPPDVALFPIGGGGLAAACAVRLKRERPAMKIIGVEASGQASMTHAFKHGAPLALPHVDRFCDATAVRKVGDLCYALCRRYLDDLITVTEEEVLHAMKLLWEEKRFLPEPSGALSLAGALQLRHRLRGKQVLTVITGANMDFERFVGLPKLKGESVDECLL